MSESRQPLTDAEINGLVTSFRYIEKARNACYNNGKRRIRKELIADLYYAGKFIIQIVETHGNEQQKKWLKNHYKIFKMKKP